MKKTEEKEKTPNKKGKWQKALKLILFLALIIETLIIIIQSRRISQLQEENNKSKGVEENSKDLVKGLMKTIEKLSYNLGKCRNYNVNNYE